MANNVKKKAQRQVKKQAKKTVKKHKRFFLILLLVILIIIGVTFVLYQTNEKFREWLPFEIVTNAPEESSENDESSSVSSSSSLSESFESQLSSSSFDGESHDSESHVHSSSDFSSTIIGEATDFSIHFLEVGNEYTGDSIYIKAGDTDILIDAGSRQSSAQTIETYVNKYCTDGKLEYVIATHAHQDHIAGMLGNVSSTAKYKNYKNEAVNGNGIYYYYDIDTIIDFAITDQSETTTSGGKSLYGNYIAARNYAVSKGATRYSADMCIDEVGGAMQTYEFAPNLSMTILYNKYYFEHSSDENNYSVCTLFNMNGEYYLLTGDLEEDGEKSMVEYYKSNPLPHCKVYKAGHHGSGTSSSEELLEMITPENVCICCCAGSSEYTANADTMFVYQDTINKLAKYTTNVFATTYFDYTSNTFKSLNGNIVVSSIGGNVTISGSNNTTKLKDTAWFNQTIYVVVDAKGNPNICSGKAKKDWYTADTSGAIARPMRTWPDVVSMYN